MTAVPCRPVAGETIFSMLERPKVADAGLSVRRVRRHFADVQDRVLTGGFEAVSSESRPSEVGHPVIHEWQLTGM
jgi:hypothetical protein